jgi:hypothetical protein
MASRRSTIYRAATVVEEQTPMHIFYHSYILSHGRLGRALSTLLPKPYLISIFITARRDPY